MDDFKRCDDSGVGGWKCPCCGPRSSKDKCKARRLMRRRLKQKTESEINDEIKKSDD
jgi:hypothetical protein